MEKYGNLSRFFNTKTSFQTETTKPPDAVGNKVKGKYYNKLLSLHKYSINKTN